LPYSSLFASSASGPPEMNLPENSRDGTFHKDTSTGSLLLADQPPTEIPDQLARKEPDGTGETQQPCSRRFPITHGSTMIVPFIPKPSWSAQMYG
jgi:hypothetical protein